MATLTDLIPMDILFVVVFGFLPVIVSIYDTGIENITSREWASFAIIIFGALLVFGVSSVRTSVQMQRYLWPLLAILALGMLLYRRTLEDKGEWDESTIERGATSYDED